MNLTNELDARAGLEPMPEGVLMKTKGGKYIRALSQEVELNLLAQGWDYHPPYAGYDGRDGHA